MTAKSFKVEFAITGYNDEPRRIEITYRIENYRVNGEVYFSADDFGCLMANGEFEHPYSGLRYKLHVPCGTKNTDCILDVLRWSNVGRSEPKEV